MDCCLLFVSSVQNFLNDRTLLMVQALPVRENFYTDYPGPYEPRPLLTASTMTGRMKRSTRIRSDPDDLRFPRYGINQRNRACTGQVPVHLSRVDEQQGTLPPDLRAMGVPEHQQVKGTT